jgi:hypothetical protein
VSIDPEFRTPEQEVLKLLEECAELRRTLKTISAQLVGTATGLLPVGRARIGPYQS